VWDARATSRREQPPRLPIAGFRANTAAILILEIILTCVACFLLSLVNWPSRSARGRRWPRGIEMASANRSLVSVDRHRNSRAVTAMTVPERFAVSPRHSRFSNRVDGVRPGGKNHGGIMMRDSICTS